MKILCKLEGGLGDCFLGNRFIHAVKEVYPYADYTIAFDTELNYMQENAMKSMWPSIYKNSYTLGKRIDPYFVVRNKKGIDIMYPQHALNLPDNFSSSISEYDRYYDFHISSLNFMRYDDIPWMKWYYFFPKPENTTTRFAKPLPEKFILVHLYPRKNTDNNLDRQYAHELMHELKKILPVVAICNKEDASWYGDVPNVLLYDLSIPEIFDIASKCTICYAADSSIRYIPLHFSKPTFVFSKHCHKANSIRDLNIAHSFRWLVFKNNILPINHDIDKVVRLTTNILSNPAYSIYPEFAQGLDLAVGDVYEL